MKNSVLVALFLSTFGLVAVSCGGDDLGAIEDSGAIEVEDARYRIARPDLGAGYLLISNTTDTDMTLEGASAEGVGRIELHESVLGDDGTMAMEARPDGFVIASGTVLRLEPGGKHLMIFDPVGTADLAVSLHFGSVTVEVVARYDAKTSAMTDDSMGDMDHGEGEDIDS